jgi:LPXTG-motif cell wall-anchored protein
LGVINVTNGVLYTEASDVVDGAKLALVTAYENAAGRTPPTETLVGPTLNLAGRTLTKGVYKSATSISIGLDGTLTLDAQDDPNAVFIFQASTETLITGSDSSVVLINGAQACNVFWQVGSSATFGTGSSFVGTVMALTSISAQTGATFQGQLLARNGAVTLEGNTIVNDACVAAAAPEPEPEPGPAPSPAPIPEDSTVDGGVIPETGAADWLAPLGIGLAVAILAAALLLRNRRTD